MNACTPPHKTTNTTINNARPFDVAQHITIGFSTTNHFVSKAIRWVTHSLCSHAWFCYNEQVVNTNKIIRKVAQAEWFGYETRPRWRWDKQQILIAEFELIGPDASNAIHTVLNKYLGSKYDYRAAMFTGLWHLSNRLFKSNFKNPSKLMCSEGVIRMLNHANYQIGRHLNPEITSPQRLMQHCFQWPNELKLIYALPQVLKKYRV
ncbi:MAG: hypothetical protein PVI90_00200 [Desulfobacteraceae bacterium]|jgi:hypothetical protein